MISKMRLKLWFVSGIFSFCILFGVGLSRLLSAQQAPSENNGLEDNLQRAYQINQYAELSKSGPERGENIYFDKCFVCHNHYVKGSPPLKDLFKYSSLYSGDPVDDQTVAAQIKNGSSGMPGFGHSLNDKDI